jgi:hypothetical protein
MVFDGQGNGQCQGSSKAMVAKMAFDSGSSGGWKQRVAIFDSGNGRRGRWWQWRTKTAFNGDIDDNKAVGRRQGQREEDANATIKSRQWWRQRLVATVGFGLTVVMDNGIQRWRQRTAVKGQQGKGSKDTCGN